MIDKRALSFVNLFGILGAIPKLCELDKEARGLIAGERMSIGFSVKGGPVGTLIFENGKCRMEEGLISPKIKLPFSSPEKFNGMIDGTVTPIPSLGFLHIGFLLKKFIKLTDILTKYLRATEEDLKDAEFKRLSTTLMFQVIAGAICNLANNDPVSKVSASYIVDGDILFSVGGGPKAVIRAKDHKLSLADAIPDGEIMSYMEFRDMDVARDLFDGRINSVASVGFGDVRVGGMISQLDNLNRILDRVSVYLA